MITRCSNRRPSMAQRQMKRRCFWSIADFLFLCFCGAWYLNPRNKFFFWSFPLLASEWQLDAVLWKCNFRGLFSPFLLCLSLTAFATYIFAKTLRQLRTKEAWPVEWYSPEFRKKNLWHKFDGLGIYNSRFSALFEPHDTINHILFQVIGHTSSMADIYAPNNAPWCFFYCKSCFVIMR